MHKTEKKQSKDNDYLLQMYLQQIAKYRSSPEQLPLITRRAKAGDLEARAQIANLAIGLIGYIANKYQSQTVPPIDLFQQGNLGLMKAIDKHNQRKGAKITTYARDFILGDVFSYLMENKYPMAIPKNSRGVVLSFVYLDEPKKSCEEQDTRDQYERTPSDEPTPYEKVERTSRLELVKKLVKKSLNILNEKQRRVISMRFGLDDGKEMKLMEIAIELKISENSVSRMVKRALKNLKEYYLENEKFEEVA